MRKLVYAASVIALPHSGGGGGGQSTPAWMRHLPAVRFSTRRPIRNGLSSCSLRVFTLQEAVCRPAFQQHRRIVSRAASSDAEASAQKRSPWEDAFEKALYKDFAHPSSTDAADIADAASSSDVADKNSLMGAASHTDDLMATSEAVALETPENFFSAGATDSTTLSAETGAILTPVTQSPTANLGRISDIKNLPLSSSVSRSHEESCTHLTAELAFEQALYGDFLPTGDGEGGTTDIHSTSIPASTSNKPTGRLTGEEAGEGEESREDFAAAAIGVAAHVSPNSLSGTPGHLLRRGGAELSKEAPSPLKAAMPNGAKSRAVLSTTPTTTSRATFESAEASFERALYDDATMKPPSGKADVLVPSHVTIPETDRDKSRCSGAPPPPPAPSSSPDAPDSTTSYPDGSAAVVLVRSAHDTATGGAIKGTPASDISEAEVESTPQGQENARQPVDNAADTEESHTAETTKDAKGVTGEKGVPPPTVSMRCIFDLGRRDAPADTFSLFDALFRVTDHHTAVVTHIDPEDRVRRCMPLLDRISKRELFFASGWIVDLERAEGTNAAPLHTEGAPGFVGSPAPAPCTHREVVGRSKVLRTLLFRLLHAQHDWWDQVQEVVLLAMKEAEETQTSCRAVVGALTGSEDTQRTPCDEGVDDATESVVVSDSGTAVVGGLVRHTTVEDVQAAMTRIFGTDPQQVHFFSDALCEALTTFCNPSGAINDCADDSFSAFEGPVAAWNAFVLTQRHRTTWVCGPHRRPFSFGEGQPTITISDLAPLQYCESAASWSDAPSPEPFSCADVAAHSANARRTDGDTSVAETHVERLSPLRAAMADATAVDNIAMAWETMSEEEQNTFLFGAESAQLSLRVRDSGGVYAVFGQHNMPFEMVSMLAEAEVAAEQHEALEKEETEADAADRGDIHTPGQVLPLEMMRNQEAANVRAYNVDRVVLELMNGERSSVAVLPVGRSIFLSSLAAVRGERSGRASPEQRRRGRIGMATSASTLPFQWQLENHEDVQLAALWQSFVRAPTGDLIGNLVYVRRHAGSLMHDSIVDIAVQKAFWLLFFARDEVRAVTHPKRTYETLWNLHHQLVALFVLSRGDGSASSLTPRPLACGREDAQMTRPAFEDLSLQSQVSYACFGCAHLPPRPCASAVPPCPSPLTTGTASVDDRLHIDSPVSVHSASPTGLYTALAESYNRQGPGQVETRAMSSTSADNLQVSDSERANFATLSTLQKLAVGFCFPRNRAESDEAALLLATGGSSTVADALGAKALEAMSTENDPRSAHRESSPDAGSNPACKGQPLKDGTRMHPDASTTQGATSIRELEIHDGYAPDNMSIWQAQRVLEGSVYECLRSLRAAGVLPAPLPSLARSRGDIGVTLALFSDEQRRKVWRAVQDITAAVIEGQSMESSVGTSSLAKARMPTNAQGKKLRTTLSEVELADALASPQRRGWRAARTARSPRRSAVTMGSHKHHEVNETLMASDVPLKRKRGRKPRAASFDTIDGASEERKATAGEQTGCLSKLSKRRDIDRRARKDGAAGQENGVTNEEVARVMALFCEGAA
ncbi:hypothetical protein, conserved [Leishmania tarentolae]|uniref:Uncharacterized protein n=1 Tax=Leishmania tarentolae TaxID=5689 RepID=A0A640KL21_LEITA|nr:hypothetical protein, conserved [Leishmania tarentolae]